VLTASSDYNLLSAFAARRTNGALTLLVINKDSLSTFTAQIALTNFTPNAAVTIYSYGMPQDNAANTGLGSSDIARSNLFVPGTNFTYAFAPYSVTVFAFAPTPPTLTALPMVPGATQFVLRLQAQPGAPYVLQVSTNLTTWTPSTTNTPAAPLVNLTNSVPAETPRQFWRAVWEP